MRTEHRVQQGPPTTTCLSCVQEFACKNNMDLVFASFVQTADDVRFIRKVRACVEPAYTGGVPYIRARTPPASEHLKSVRPSFGELLQPMLDCGVRHRQHGAPLQVLREGGAPHIKIIVKIESQAGVRNFDEVLAETDGVMVARGEWQGRARAGGEGRGGRPAARRGWGGV